MQRSCARPLSSVDLGYGPEINRDAVDPTAISVLGSVALDTIETPWDRRERLLGGSATYFAAAARLFTAVKIVSVVGEDFLPRDEAELASLGVDLSGLERLPGKTYAWHGSYGSDFANATTVARQVGVIGDYTPPADLGADEEALFLGATDPAIQRQVLDASARTTLSALDSREAWIEQSGPELLALCDRVDFVILNVFELAALTGRGSTEDGAAMLLAAGARGVIVKQGAAGAALYAENLTLSVPAYETTVVDPTGAGDAFAGGFMGTLAGSHSRDVEALRDALRHGAAMASVALESFGIEALAGLDRDELALRADALEERMKQ